MAPIECPAPQTEDDPPLHPAVVRLAARYACAAAGEQDAVVAEILTELNALLQGARPAGSAPTQRA